MFVKNIVLTIIASRLASLVLCTPVNPSPVEDSKILNARAPSSFTHPGVLLDIQQLDFIKSKVNSNAQPWANAYQAMLSSDLASLTRTASPKTTVECGSKSQNPDVGCHEEREDALAAYAMSLAWYITGNTKYAQKAIYYMNAWSPVITGHSSSNAPLQTGWAGSSWARAAEIIRHTNAGWSSSDITKFENMLRTVYLPTVIAGSSSAGNWELVMMEAAQGIAVFLDDGASYDKAMAKYQVRVPGYIYLTSDGQYPKQAPGSGSTSSSIISYWNHQSTFPESGICQETCRDFVHTGYGLSSISHIAETSRIQGNDLYPGDIGTRLRYGLGFQSKYENGAAVPSWLCGGSLTTGLGPITEVGYNALAFRENNVMTNTGTLTNKNRPAGTNKLFVGWETLTHAENPN